MCFLLHAEFRSEKCIELLKVEGGYGEEQEAVVVGRETNIKCFSLTVKFRFICMLERRGDLFGGKGTSRMGEWEGRMGADTSELK